MALSNDHTENSITRPRIIHIICLMPGCFWKPNINSVLSFTNILPTMLAIIIRLSKSKNNLQKTLPIVKNTALPFAMVVYVLGISRKTEFEFVYLE